MYNKLLCFGLLNGEDGQMYAYCPSGGTVYIPIDGDSFILPEPAIDFTARARGEYSFKCTYTFYDPDGNLIETQTKDRDSDHQGLMYLTFTPTLKGIYPAGTKAVRSNATALSYDAYYTKLKFYKIDPNHLANE